MRQEEQARHAAAQRLVDARLVEGLEAATDVDDVQSSDSSGACSVGV